MMGLVDLGSVIVDPWRVEAIVARPHAREGSTIHLHSGAILYATQEASEAQRLLDEGKGRMELEFKKRATAREERLRPQSRMTGLLGDDQGR